MSRVSVLVADDDAMTRTALARELAKHFFVRKVVPDGVELLKAALEEHVDVIVTDLCMPGLNGLDVMGVLTSQGRTIPFVLVSATRGLARDCVGLGARAFVFKADVARELIPAVRAALDGRTYVSETVSAD